MKNKDEYRSEYARCFNFLKCVKSVIFLIYHPCNQHRYENVSIGRVLLLSVTYTLLPMSVHKDKTTSV